jgi:uncharacterized protein YidB (DUF937 family)
LNSKEKKTMGLLDDVMGVVGMGNTNAQQQAGTLDMLLQYINSPQVGGIAGLQKMFQENGLGGIVSSWISTGQNLPISGDQLQSVLHGDALQNIAAKLGMDQSQVTSVLSGMLPTVVDSLTPNGQMPDSNALSQMMKGLAAGQA